jgi:hypothetical protein
MGEATSTLRRSSLLKLLAKSVAVCVIGGAVFGSTAWALIMAGSTGNTEVLSALPVLPFYALPITVPFGTLAGVVGALIGWQAQGAAWRPATKTGWVSLGAAAGLLLGAAAPIFLTILGFSILKTDEILFWTGTGGATGAVCGGLLAAWAATDMEFEVRGRPTTRCS